VGSKYLHNTKSYLLLTIYYQLRIMLPIEEEEDKEQAKEQGRSWMKYSGMAVQMIVPILVFVFAGQYLDEWLGTDPWMMVVLSLLGVTAGLYISLKDFL
jgi:F0F1-type ATP synthase assembly protein I